MVTVDLQERSPFCERQIGKEKTSKSRSLLTAIGLRQRRDGASVTSESSLIKTVAWWEVVGCLGMREGWCCVIVEEPFQVARTEMRKSLWLSYGL